MIAIALAVCLAALPVHAFRVGAEWVIIDDAGKLVARPTAATASTTTPNPTKYRTGIVSWIRDWGATSLLSHLVRKLTMSGRWLTKE